MKNKEKIKLIIRRSIAFLIVIGAIGLMGYNMVKDPKFDGFFILMMIVIFIAMLLFFSTFYSNNKENDDYYYGYGTRHPYNYNQDPEEDPDKIIKFPFPKDPPNN